MVGDTSERRGVELLSTTTKDDINGGLGPGVVCNTVEESVDDGAVLATGTSVGNKRSRRGIGNVSGRDNTNVSTSEAVEHLGNCLNLGVIERILAGVRVDVQAVDGTLVSGVEGSSRVGRIGNEAVNGVCHLMTEDGEFVHGHGGLVLSVDALVSDQAGGRDHVRGHTITNEQNDVLGLALLSQVTDEPSCLSLAAVVVVEGCSVLARLVERNATVGLGGDIDEGWLLRITSE